MSHDEITRVALDYFEGWFDGDVTRMRRALHPDLAKRTLAADGSGAESLRTTTAERMFELTESGEGRKQDPGDRRIEVDVEDVHETIANVTVRSAVYREYLQLARTGEGWKIVNALWERS
jgi:CRP-like cAMP-binding protein